MAKPGRKPRLERSPNQGKQPRIEQDPEDARFRWRCDRPDFGGPWGWHLIHPCDLHQRVLKHLHDYEGMTWMELQKNRKTGSGGSIPVRDLHQKAISRMSLLGIEEEHLFEVKIDGFSTYPYPRVWGFRSGQVLNILWWDPHHEVYHTEANKHETRKRNAPLKKRHMSDHTNCPLAGRREQSGDRCEHCFLREASQAS